MVLQTWGDAILASLQQVWLSVASFFPVFIGAVVVFILGWIIAVALGKLVEQIIRALKVDQLLSKLDFESTMQRAGMRIERNPYSEPEWLQVVGVSDNQ